MARPDSRRAQLVSNEILEHAERFFAQKGYAGTTLQDIADSMGVSRPAIYHYIKNKEDLLASLLYNVAEEVIGLLTRVSERIDLPADARLELAVRQLTAYNAQKGMRLQALDRSIAHLPPSLAETFRNGRRHVLKQMTSLVDDAIKTGTIRPLPARTVAFALLGQVNWVSWWYRPNCGETPEEIADIFASLAMTGLRRPDSNHVPAGPWGALKLLKDDLINLEQTLAVALPTPQDPEDPRAPDQTD